MSFLQSGFGLATKADGRLNLPFGWKYLNTDDSVADMTAVDYFLDEVNNLNVGDLIHVLGSDGPAFLKVITSDTAVETAVFVSNEAAFFIPLVQQSTTVGGAATEAITVTGALTTDFVFVNMETQGAAPVTILAASITAADTVSVVFSADPSNDHVVNISVQRAL